MSLHMLSPLRSLPPCSLLDDQSFSLTAPAMLRTTSPHAMITFQLRMVMTFLLASIQGMVRPTAVIASVFARFRACSKALPAVHPMLLLVNACSGQLTAAASSANQPPKPQQRVISPSLTMCYSGAAVAASSDSSRSHQQQASADAAVRC